MNNVLEVQEKEINILFKDIKALVITSRNKVYQTVNTECLVYTGTLAKRLWKFKKGR